MATVFFLFFFLYCTTILNSDRNEKNANSIYRKNCLEAMQPLKPNSERAIRITIRSGPFEFCLRTYCSAPSDFTGATSRDSVAEPCRTP